MKVVILAGGLGTRISEETLLKPKPMIEIGNMPLIWHIMQIYSYHGIFDFIICCGYKGYVIKEFFSNYLMHMSDVTIDLRQNSINFHTKNVEPWKLTLVDTGDETMTGGRLKRVEHLLKNDEFFCLTYGDGLSDLDINALIKFHKDSKTIATLTAIHPPGRFGSLDIKDHSVVAFKEKPKGDGAMINGGFFVMNSKIFDYLVDDYTILEREPLERLANEKQLSAFKHNGFWFAMDTLRDKNTLEKYWTSGVAPWKVW